MQKMPDEISTADAPPHPSADDQMGMDWWNGLTETARANWLKSAASARPVDAWAAFKAHGKEPDHA
jgi:hypothetical protein